MSRVRVPPGPPIKDPTLVVGFLIGLRARILNTPKGVEVRIASGNSQGHQTDCELFRSKFVAGLQNAGRVPPGLPKLPKQIPVSSNSRTPVVLPLICICYLIQIRIGLIVILEI